jgi:hypothetical protein
MGVRFFQPDRILKCERSLGGDDWLFWRVLQPMLSKPLLYSTVVISAQDVCSWHLATSANGIKQT